MFLKHFSTEFLNTTATLDKTQCVIVELTEKNIHKKNKTRLVFFIIKIATDKYLRHLEQIELLTSKHMHRQQIVEQTLTFSTKLRSEYIGRKDITHDASFLVWPTICPLFSLSFLRRRENQHPRAPRSYK